MSKHLWGALAMALACPHVLSAVEVPLTRMYEIPVASAAPTLDGVINEDEWRNAVRIPSGGAFAREAEFFMMWTPDALHLAQRSPLRPGELPLTRYRDPSKGTSVHDDTCEIWVMTDQSGQHGRVPEYFQSIFGPADGVIFHLNRQYSIGIDDASWSPRWTTRNRITPDGKFWETECRIPVADFFYKGELKDGVKWKVGLNRNWKRPWQWGGVDYHMPDVEVVFRENAPAIRLAGAGALNQGKASFTLTIDPLGRRVDGSVLLRVTQKENHAEKTMLERELPIALDGTTPMVVGPFDDTKLTPGQSGQLTVTITRGGGQLFYNWKRDFKAGDLAGLEFESNKEAFFVDVLSNPVKEFTDIQADFYELPKARRDQVAHGVISISGNGKSVVEIDAGKPVDFRLSGRVRWPKDLPCGTYSYTVSLRDVQGGTVAVVERGFEKLDPAKTFPWWNNSVGLSRRVLEPWTPVDADKDSAAVWGRRISFDTTGLPAQVTSQDRPLLAAPVRLVGALPGGSPVEFKGTGVSLLDRSQDKSVHVGAMSGCGVRIEARCETEFDGCVKVTLDLSPEAAPVKLAELALLIPLRGETSAILRANENRIRQCNYFVGRLPPGQGTVWDSRAVNQVPVMTVGSYSPYIWLGDEEVGLCCFGDSDEGWWPSDARPAQEVVREKDTVTLRLNLVSEPVTLDKPRRIVLGLMANPVKPLRRDAKPVQTVMFGDASPGRVDKDDKTVPREAQGQRPFPMLVDVSRANCRKLRAEGKAVSPYIAHTDFPAIDPKEATYFAGAWTDTALGDVAPRNLRIVRSLADYHVYWYDQWMKECDISGFYVDNIYGNMTRNADMGPAYKLPDGRIQPGFMLWENREYIRRLQAVLQDRGVQPREVWLHMTNNVLLPVLSFCDVILQGEDRSMSPGGQNHVQAWPIDDLVTSCYAPSFGWRCEFLGSWRAEPNDPVWAAAGDPGARKLTRGIVATLWPLGMRMTWRGNQEVQRKASWDIFNFTGSRFGLPLWGHPWPADFSDPADDGIPFWKTASMVQISKPDVKATLWKKTDRLLVMLSNLGGSSGDVTLRLPLRNFWGRGEPLGGSYFPRAQIVVDQENGSRVPVKYDRTKHELEATLKLEPYDFRLIQIVR